MHSFIWKGTDQFFATHSMGKLILAPGSGTLKNILQFPKNWYEQQSPEIRRGKKATSFEWFSYTEGMSGCNHCSSSSRIPSGCHLTFRTQPETNLFDPPLPQGLWSKRNSVRRKPHLEKTTTRPGCGRKSGADRGNLICSNDGLRPQGLSGLHADSPLLPDLSKQPC